MFYILPQKADSALINACKLISKSLCYNSFLLFVRRIKSTAEFRMKNMLLLFRITIYLFLKNLFYSCESQNKEN